MNIYVYLCIYIYTHTYITLTLFFITLAFYLYVLFLQSNDDIDVVLIFRELISILLTVKQAKSRPTIPNNVILADIVTKEYMFSSV